MARETTPPYGLNRISTHTLYPCIPASQFVADHIENLRHTVTATVRQLFDTYRKDELFARWRYVMERNIWAVKVHPPRSTPPQSCEITIEVRGLSPKTYIHKYKKSVSITIDHPIFNSPDSVLNGETRLLRDQRNIPPGYYFFGPLQIDPSPSDKWEEFDIKFEPTNQGYERFNDMCLDSFKQNMVVRINYGTKQNTLQELISNPNLENIPRYKRTQNRIFRWFKSKQDQERLTTVTIIKMQKYLGHLIRAHSIRVEQYKWATKAMATDVARDIRTVMNEIWGNLIR
ncbi:unnamed protein product [Rhizoctonia solani]|uniref:Uncharacterized protein n=1 Tax=Rhizoctonia solani TaxID=456999 RepID=A0A8H3AXE4_9AGAM